MHSMSFHETKCNSLGIQLRRNGLLVSSEVPIAYMHIGTFELTWSQIDLNNNNRLSQITISQSKKTQASSRFS